ncbi:ABC transporter ATP-binding protein [Egicoccus halophilus]|uniref:ABC transporter ATP-binding protein n=1 Tax=Egicoccus halophilus TaxID=1670830 RepID=A0A8J3ACK7_9ACTN|nr:ABC transporter ATP-binding protein [Egicoccus halophilus]GGI08689.1 ABC transporter ATP-binding protein [Egicoccus halophilus]
MEATLQQQATAKSARGSSLVVRDLVVRYGEVEAVSGISFAAEPGDFITLLGPSGCGKSTTLRCIAGLETPSGGTIAIDGRTVAGPGVEVPPERRGINMVFQSYAIWPHMSVFDNVAYGLRGRGANPRLVRERTLEALELVGLPHLENRFGTELSGGQQQRVAVARAVVTRPGVILFDEPLSNLDAGLRERMREELLELQRQVGLTALYVTHDQTEAMSMSDRVVLMNHGVIEQADPPRQLYRRPASMFAASFVGNANLVRGRLTDLGSGAGRLATASGDIAVVGELEHTAAGEGDAVAVFRPENVVVGDAAEAMENRWIGQVVQAAYLGPRTDVTFEVAGQPIRAVLHPEEPVEPGDRVTVGVAASHVHFVPAEG